MNKYFTETNEYQKPTFITFDAPKTIKLHQLEDFLDEYRPFHCADVYIYSAFEFGDFENWVDAIVKNVYIDPKYSRYIKEDEGGIYTKGKTKYSIVHEFWDYNADTPFWNECTTQGYGDSQVCNNINELEITIKGLFVISWSDKEQIEFGAKFNILSPRIIELREKQKYQEEHKFDFLNVLKGYKDENKND